MSRNKLILLIMLLALAYFIMPDDGIFGTIKVNFVMILPYIMVGVIVYLIITINVLKRAWKKLDAQVNDENVIKFAKMLNITFDVKRMLGPNNLLDLYAKVNFSQKTSLHAKQLLYEALRRKRLDVPPPGQGGDPNKPLRPVRTNAEIKAARIEAAAKEKRRKHKK